MSLTSLLLNQLHLPANQFEQTVVVVTGAGRGIGRDIARAFAYLGARVVLAELSQKGQALQEEIQAAGGQAHFIQTDVSDPHSVQHLLKQTRAIYGDADILINNAIYIQQSAVLETTLADWDRTLAVNLRGTFLTCQAFLPGMLANGKGLILNLVSTDAMPGLSAYIASKQGITGFSQSLDLEISPQGVYVIPFAPGMVDTPGIRSVAEGLAPRLGLNPEQFLSLSLHSAYDGLMPAEHAAAATVYLAAHLAEEFHGQVINGYEVLERAGLISPSPAASLTDAGTLTSADTSLQDLLAQTLNMLAETEAEFMQLPVFVRPIARQGFKAKSGKSLPDWQRLIQMLQQDPAQMPPDFKQLLHSLMQYYREVPQESARFTRDSETLRQIQATCSQRIAILQNLANQ